MTTYVLDNFTDTDGVDLTAHTPDTDTEGNGWVLARGDGFEVQSNVAEKVNSGSEAINANQIDSGQSDCVIEVDIVIGSGGTNAAPGILFRHNGTAFGSSSADGFIVWLNRSANQLQLLRVDNDSTTSLDTDAVTVNGGDSFTITLTLNGTSISASCSGADTGSVSATSSSYQTNGRHGIYAVDNGVTTRSTFDAFEVRSANAITLTDVTDGEILQRNSGVASRTVSGTYSGSPTNIEYRLVDHGTDTAVTGHDWQTLEASPTGDTFSASVTGIPAGGWYNVDVRFSNDTGTVANGANRLGVGIRVAIIGQSNGSNWFDEGANPGATANDVLRMFNASGWATIGANADGAKSFGNSLITGLTTAIPVALLDYAVSATALRSEADSGAGYWLDATANEPYDLFTDGAVTDLGGECEFVVWIQGERDARSDLVTEAEYESSLTTFISNVRSDLTNRSGQTNLPFIISRLGRGTVAGDDDDDFQAIRNAQRSVADTVADVYFIEAYDLDIPDGTHYSNAAYITHGQRAAQAPLDILGEETYHQGPAISSWSRSGTSVTVNLTHRGGTDFTPTTGITGFRFTDGGTPITINSAVRTNATTITLTLASTPSGAEQLDYAYGANPTISSVVVDNSALTLPLENVEAANEAGGTVIPKFHHHYQQMRAA